MNMEKESVDLKTSKNFGKILAKGLLACNCSQNSVTNFYEPQLPKENTEKIRMH